ncbi:hypothetical protein IT568_07960 [bacterium]|nr:hypothetical protein [bacterium]
MLKLLLLIFLVTTSFAKTKIAVVEFDASVDGFFLSNIAQTFPDLLQTELSKFENFTIVERRNLDKILREKMLNESELGESSNELGLVSADFIVSGKVVKTEDDFIQINVKILEIQTGTTLGEKVVGLQKNTSEMAELLAKNIHRTITGFGKKETKVKVTHKNHKPLIFTTLAISSLATFSLWQAKQTKKDYKNETKLSEIEKKYDKANTWNRIAVSSVSVAAILGTVTLFKVFSGSQREDFIYATINSDEVKFNFSLILAGLK